MDASPAVKQPLLLSQVGVNIKTVNITRPPKYILTVGFEVNYPSAFDGLTQNLGQEDPPNDKIGDYGHGFFMSQLQEII